MSTTRRRRRRHETVRQAIARYAPNEHLAEALSLGALLEGGTLGAGPFGVGDSGHSHGPFQINDVYHHNLTVRQAENPDYAVRYMLPAYRAAARKVPRRLWRTNPELAAERTAFLAERPKYDYLDSRSYGASGVNTRWQQVTGKVGRLQHTPFTLTANTGDLPTTSSGLSTWITANVVLVVVVLVVILLVKKR